jgi:hypothetical protein
MLSYVLLVACLSFTSFAFPGGRCFDRACSSTPYDLRFKHEQNGMFCFDILQKSCQDTSQYKCCQVLSQFLQKVVIQSRPECKSAVKHVTVNGRIKGGGVYFETYNANREGELRITSLRMPNMSAIGLEICVALQDPCPSYTSFCGGAECLSAVFDPATHACCPTCPFAIASVPTNPNPPPRQPPRPPQILSLSPPPRQPPRPSPPSPPVITDHQLPECCACQCECQT